MVYVLLGAIGLPVFAGFSGGIQNLVGPTGGFLISFPIMAWLIGVGVEKEKRTGMFILFLILGTVANYVIGVVMFCAIMHASVTTAVAACVIPFIPTAIIKAVVAAILGLRSGIVWQSQCSGRRLRNPLGVVVSIFMKCFGKISTALRAVHECNVRDRLFFHQSVRLCFRPE